MLLYLYLFLFNTFILSIESAQDSDNEEFLGGISIKDLEEDPFDAILVDESNENSTESDFDRETEIRNAVEIFRKYDLWNKACEIHSSISGEENKSEFVKTQNQAIRDTRKSNSKPKIVEFSSDITEQMKNDAINVALNAFRNYDDLKTISSLLSDSFNKKYEKFWQCFVGLDSKQYDYKFWRNSYLTMNYDKIVIHLFRASVAIPSEYDTIDQIRKSKMPSIQIVDSEMSDVTKREVINQTLDAIKTFDTFLDISTHLQQTFDKNHGKYWQSIVKHKSHPISSKFKFSAKLFIHITIGDLSVILYKSPTVTSQDVINSVKSSSSEAIVYLSEMNNTMENEVKQIAIDGINYYNEFEEIGKYIKNVSESRFGDNWNCVVGVKPHYDANAVSKAPNSYMLFGFANGDDEIVITLYRSKIKNTIEAIIKARIAKPKVIETSLNNSMNTQIIDICTQSLTMFDNFRKISKFISESLDKTYSPHWHCIIGFKTYFESEDNNKSVKNSVFTELEFEDLKILLFKSS